MMLSSQQVYEEYGQEMYFFALKKVKDSSAVNDILQNSFVKIHRHLPSLKEESKLRAWVFRIVRNEIANYFNDESSYQYDPELENKAEQHEFFEDVCCFDRFIHDLPAIYKEVIVLTYLKGKKQEDVASSLGLGLANVKARIRRAKSLLKDRFQECCKFDVNKEGKLVGSPDCTSCD